MVLFWWSFTLPLTLFYLVFFLLLILTLWARRATGSDTGGCRRRIPLPCTHMSRTCKKQPIFEENWMSFLKMLVLTLNSPQLLRYSRLKLLFLLFFLNANFSKYSRAEWVKHTLTAKNTFGQLLEIKELFQFYFLS